MFALGRGLQQTTGPFVVTLLAVEMGWPGWIVLGGLLLLAGLACPPLTRAAERALGTARPQGAAEPSPAV